MRLFIAILLSDPAKRHLLRAVDALRADAKSGIFTREENLHLTLAFLGETTRVRDLEQAMTAISFTPFELVIRSAGNFHRSVQWAGVEPSPPLLQLVKDLQAQLKKQGFSTDERAFCPHITLAREYDVPCASSIVIPEIVERVERISLMKSERIHGRLIYSQIYYKQCNQDG